MRAYPKSSAILRREGAQVPERLSPDAFNEYMIARASEEAQYAAADAVHRQHLRDARARGHAVLKARKTARHAKVAAAFALDPLLNRAALARVLGVHTSTIGEDLRELGLLGPSRAADQPPA